MRAIQRHWQTRESVTLTTVLGTTPEIDKPEFAAGTVFIPNGSSITALTFYGAMKRGGTYLALYDSGANPVTLNVAANRAYELPDAVYAVPHLKIVATTADGAVDLVFVS